MGPVQLRPAHGAAAQSVSAPAAPGLPSYAIGDLIYASGSTTLSKLADVATGNALISGGITTAPSWGKITSSHLNITTTSCTNQFVSAVSATGTGTCSTVGVSPAWWRRHWRSNRARRERRQCGRTCSIQRRGRYTIFHHTNQRQRHGGKSYGWQCHDQRKSDGDVTSVGNATTLTNAPVIAKVLTGYVSGSGTVSAADSILSAIQKLNGNDALKAPIASPTFTGTVTAPTLAATTINAFTLGGTVSGGGNQINNIVIGNTTPLAGTFTTLNSNAHTIASGQNLTLSAGSGIIDLTNGTTLFRSSITGAMTLTSQTGTVQVPGLNYTSISANGTAGITKACTIASTTSLTFTLGILTATSGAGCV
jgi:hypothetical protein